MSRSEPLKFDTTTQVRMTRAERDSLDDWRRRQREIPSRPEAIREAIRRLVAESRADSEARSGGGRRQC
jgi:Arc/MetJ-type ribon-helix-helix transcriptional regulator